MLGKIEGAAENGKKLQQEELSNLLAGYLRRSACAAAAGMGAFGLAASSAEGAIRVGEPANYFMQRSLVGNTFHSAASYAPDPNNPEERLSKFPPNRHLLIADPGSPTPGDFPQEYPFASVGWLTQGYVFQYAPIPFEYNGNPKPPEDPAEGFPDGNGFNPYRHAPGIDIDANGHADINFFRTADYYGGLFVNTHRVGLDYYGRNVFSTSSDYPNPHDGTLGHRGQVTLISNDADNADQGSTSVGGDKQIVQGFLAGQIIGDTGDTVFPDSTKEGVMRNVSDIGDWEGTDPTLLDPSGAERRIDQFQASDPYYGLYERAQNYPPAVSSYVGFQIELDGGATGFGWIEVVVREVTHVNYTNYSDPELQVIRWAYTDDGTTIQAGQTTEDPDETAVDADFNNDGKVDGLDFLDWQLGFAEAQRNGLIPLRFGGNSDYDGDVDGVDLDNWKAAYGAPVSVAAGGATAVPEPTTLGLLAAGAGGLACALRRRKK